MFRTITAGESHGPSLLTIVEGLPAGVTLEAEKIQEQLRRRQQGYGRGRRMQIEQDRAEILSGVRHGITLGSPIALRIENSDWPNWEQEMSPLPVEGFLSQKEIFHPRPGHADLAGHLKYSHSDMRNVLERASARETAARTAAGAVARCFLEHFDLRLAGHTVRIGEVEAEAALWADPSYRQLLDIDGSALRCLDADAEQRMIRSIDEAQESGDTLGGVFEVIAFQVPVGLGSHTQWDRKLDGRIAQAVMSIPGVKAVELGEGILNAGRRGSAAHDAIAYDSLAHNYTRPTNRAGGLEGGIANGMPLRVRGFLKPISSLRTPLSSVDVRTKQAHPATYQRSDVCVAPAAAVVGEAMLALVLAEAFIEKFGGDSLIETQRNFQNYLTALKER